MSAQETKAVLQAYWAAWRAGDMAGVEKLYSDDLSFHYHGNTPETGDHFGKAACLAVLGRMKARTNRKVLAVHDTAYGETRAVVFAREALERFGERAEIERTFVYRVEDGRIAEVWIHDEDQALVDRFFAG